MPDRDTLVLFMTATFILNITPGPDMLYVIAASTDGRKAGVVASFGISGGILIHVVAVALGLAALLVAVPVAYQTLRWAGAVYLVWLGIRSIRRAGQSRAATVPRQAPLTTVFAQGVLTSTLNPKIAVFFLAFLPQFVVPDEGAAQQVVVLGSLFICSGTTVNIVVALSFHRTLMWLRHRHQGVEARAGRVLRWITGALFITLGARVALSGR